MASNDHRQAHLLHQSMAMPIKPLINPAEISGRPAFSRILRHGLRKQKIDDDIIRAQNWRVAQVQHIKMMPCRRSHLRLRVA